MKKPTVYLDTNIVSAYWYRGDVGGLARQVTTRDWWKNEREGFVVWVSAVTEDELAAGQFAHNPNVCDSSVGSAILPITRETSQIAARLVELRAVPPEKPGDALQMAVCAAHRIDYLLSWNYAHLVNPVAQEHLEAVCAKLFVRAPWLVFAGIHSQGKSGANPKEATKMTDVIVDEVRRVREELVKQHGGLDGWIEHLQEMDQRRVRTAKKRTPKKAVTGPKKAVSGPKKSRTNAAKSRSGRR